MNDGRHEQQFAEVRDVGDAAGWDLAFRQLSPGPQRIGARFVPGRAVNLVRVDFNRAYHQRGIAPPGAITVGVPITEVHSWFGKTAGEESILPFNQVSGFDSVTREGHVGWTISIDQGFLRRVSEACRTPVSGILHRPRSESLIIKSEATQSFRRLLSQISTIGQQSLGIEQEEVLVLELLNAALTGAGNADRSLPAARSKAVRAALGLIEERAQEPMTVREICEITGVPSRTLERAFKEHFGLGPKAYMTRMRLGRVREDLKLARSGAPITDVANQWGFWHMGQFARDYKALFGELPSETLASRGL